MSVHVATLGPGLFMAQCQDCDWHSTGSLAQAFNAWRLHSSTCTNVGAPRANEHAPTTYEGRKTV